MLKRYQVLLPDWLEDYINYLADKHDMNFSEVIRTAISLSILTTVPSLYPEFKPVITPKEICNLSKEYKKDKVENNGTDRILSKIYFEARKAAEYRIARDKSKKK